MGQVHQDGARHSTGAVLLWYRSYLQNVSLRCSDINLSQLKGSQTEGLIHLKSLVAAESSLSLCACGTQLVTALSWAWFTSQHTISLGKQLVENQSLPIDYMQWTCTHYLLEIWVHSQIPRQWLQELSGSGNKAGVLLIVYTVVISMHSCDPQLLRFTAHLRAYLSK